MKKIFWGFLLIFLDFNINAGTSTIGLLPDFVGYILMTVGVKEIAAGSDIFIKLCPFTVCMSIYTGVCYLLDLLGISGALEGLGVVLGIINTIVSLYISYRIIKGIGEMEKKYQTDLNSGNLEMVWMLQVIFQAGAYVSLLIPFLSIILIVAGCIVTIVFLVVFHRAAKLYEELPRVQTIKQGGM